ncbi:MAG TPA: TetR/AcrR family transcriptional regulator [Solirubrobacterales bacterium]|nr:TetR/AcrR family transcriptional regulator [Solirubrobacterales bacterium]
MPRLARGRKTHLTQEEIAVEALRQFDVGQDPSIRSLAAALGVAPTAIYHHFPSRSAIVDAALGIVWREASKEGFRLLEAADPEDPTDLLVTAALATRRAFGNHHQIAPYIAATPGASEQLAANLGLLAGTFEALGLRGEEAGRAFHAYGSFAVGSTLVLAARLNRGDDGSKGKPAPGGDAKDELADTQAALEAMIDLSYANPDRDEELFVDGLRRLIASFVPA